MKLSRLANLFVLAVPALVACNDDNDLGIGLGSGDQFTATLSGANVRPDPVVTASTAIATFTIREPAIGSSMRTMGFSLNATGLTAASAAHIHLGGAAIGDGPVLVTLFTNPADTAITSTRLATGSFTEASLGGRVGLDSLIVLMQSGAAYVDVHSRTNPAGLLRGQIVKSGAQAPGDLFVAPALTGAKERPIPVVTTATGSATFELLAGGSMRYTVKVAGLTGATMAHIHTAVSDSAGPIVVTLFTAATPTSLLTGTLATGTFTSSAIRIPGISFDSLLSLMRRGRTYVNVHTDTNPAGEIRAQIEPASVIQ